MSEQSLDVCVVDTETTGLITQDDEIVEVAVIDGAGNELFSSLVRPSRKTSWPEAQGIHGITPRDVENAPTLQEISGAIQEAVRGRIVVIYNAEFDSAMLGDCLSTAKDVRCCMRAFAQTMAELHEERERWYRLVDAAHYVDHDWGQDAAHRACHDASATLSVWRWLHAQDPELYPLQSA